MLVSSARSPLFIVGLLAGVLGTGIWMTTCHQSPPVSNVKALNSALDRAAARQAAGPVRAVHRFRNAIARQSPGSTVRLKVLREGKARKVQVTLGRLPKSKGRAARGGPSAPGRHPRGQTTLDGVKVGNLSALHRRKLELPAKVKGVLVTRVAQGSAAQQAGLRPGDVIASLNRQPTPNVGAFSRAARQVDDAILVLNHRRGSTLYLAWKKR